MCIGICILIPPSTNSTHAIANVCSALQKACGDLACVEKALRRKRARAGNPGEPCGALEETGGNVWGPRGNWWKRVGPLWNPCGTLAGPLLGALWNPCGAPLFPVHAWWNSFWSPKTCKTHTLSTHMHPHAFFPDSFWRLAPSPTRTTTSADKKATTAPTRTEHIARDQDKALAVGQLAQVSRKDKQDVHSSTLSRYRNSLHAHTEHTPRITWRDGHRE